jgi:hypothetical protein
MPAQQVDITVTNVVVGYYEARSYPDDQTDATDMYPLYSVPVYRIRVTGHDSSGKPVTADFAAPRFMPYYNNPKHPDSEYTNLGWLTAGLSSHRRVVVSTFKQNYEVQNRYSPGRGAIVVYQSFYIHAGPASLQDVGFGSAGCIEVIGDYKLFKRTIAGLSGLPFNDPDQAIQQLVEARKLIVTIQGATPPDIKKEKFTRKIKQ